MRDLHSRMSGCHDIAHPADAETRMTSDGVALARLSCAIGNARAERFYGTCGWQRVGAVTIETDTDHGPFHLKVWRYENKLR